MKPTARETVVFAPNWLGDAVMSLPALADVRGGALESSLTVAARSPIAPLFSMIPWIEDVVVLGPKQDSRPRYDAAILLPNSFQSALMAWRWGVPERWGYRTDWRRPLLTRAIDPPAGVHQVEYYRQLVGALGYPGSSASRPSLDVADDLRDAAVRELKSAGWDAAQPLVALAPGAAYGGAKRWPARSFAELARALADDGIQPVLVGSRADVPIAREIEAAFGDSAGPARRAGIALNLMGTDLPTLAGILSTCRALVSNDSGAMHLGAAVGIRVAALFGPTDERLTRPSGDGHAVLSSPVWCRPCMMRECPIDHRCMKGVGVDRVVDALRQML